MAIPGKLEGAFGADRAADPLSMAFTDLTADTIDSKVTITRGTRGGSLEAAAGSMTVHMLNPDGRYTPYKASSIYHPNMKLGLILRHSVNTGARTLTLTGAAGSNATTPDAASWNIGADMGLAVQFRSPVRVPPAGIQYEVTGQFTIAGAQRSWILYLANDGTARLRVSSDGTNELDSFTTIAVPRPDAGPLIVGCEFDGDNGSAGNTTTWYVGKVALATLLASKATYLFGDPDINSGTVTLFNSTATIAIGDVPGSGFAPYPGCIDAVYVRAGTLTSGTVVTNVDFTTATVAAANVVDTAGTPKTWAINTPASISDRKVTMVGTLDANEGNYPGQSTTGTAQREWTINGPLRRLRQGQKPLQSALFRRIMAPVNDTTVRVYYPLEEPSGAEVVSSPIDGIPPGIFAMNLGSDSSLSSSKALPSQSGGQPFGWSLSFPPVTTQTAWEAGWFMKLPAAPAGAELFDCRIDTVNGTTTQWVFRFDNTNYRLFAKDNSDPPVNVLSTTTAHDPRMFGVWVIIMVSLAQNGANIDYGVRVIPVGSGVFSTTGTLAGQTLGTPVGTRSLSSIGIVDGVSMGHFTITEGAVAGWLAPADTAYVGEPAAQRVFRLTREEGVPATVDGPYMGIRAADWLVVMAAGGRAMGAQRPLPLLTLLEECRQVDHGNLNDSRELLGIAYRSGITKTNQPARLALTSEMTSPLKPVDDDRGRVNDATVSKDNGSDARYVDTASVTADGLYEDSKTINPVSDLDLPDHAAWWVHEALVAEERYDTVPIELAKNNFVSVDDWYSLSYGDRLTASSLPSAEAKTALSQLVTGSSQTISAQLWTVKADTVAEKPWQVGVRDSTMLGRRDTSGSTTGGSLTTTATSVTVVSPVTVWTTAGGDVPFDIDIDGEQITVTAVTSATSPQTFTLTRSVNGVVKTHASGATVRLWRPAVRAH